MPAAPCDAPELLRAFLAGDAAAFGRLYDAHDRPCFDFIRRSLAPVDEATVQDLHQEVWLAVARSARSFDAEKARFVTWLFTIARNKVMDHFRRVRSGLPLADLPAPADGDDNEQHESLAGHDLTPERVAHNRQLAQALVHEVQALPLAQRETFVLFAHHELSLQEVAQVTGVGLETAKTRLRYARATLRQRLAGWELHHA